MTIRRRASGFTLVELMISVMLTLVVVLFVVQSFTAQHRSYSVVDDVSEMQQNLRAIGDLLEKEVRAAGFMVPEAASVCGVDNQNVADLLFVSDADAISPANQEKLDIGAEINAGFVGGNGSDNLVVDNVVIDANPYYDTDGDGAPDADFRNGGGAIIVDRANPTRGAACGIVTVMGPTSLLVDYDMNGGGTLRPLVGGSAAPDLLVVPAHVYTVNANLQLLRDGMILAEDVEDLQIALFYDVDGDGVVTNDPLEYPGSQLGNIYVSMNWNNEELREVRVNVVSRTGAEDPKVKDDPAMAQGVFENKENRVAPGGVDGYRRRVLTATVRPRNVGARGV